MQEIQMGESKVTLFPAGENAPLALIIGDGKTAPAETGVGISLAAVECPDWNRDLSPWPAPPLKKGEEGFSGGADAFLNRLTGKILPEILNALGGSPAGVFLAGYSLAGLFSLYALCRTDAFDGAVSASGSLWYPGFVEYAARHAFLKQPRRIYLSLGDREKRTSHPLMRTVEDDTRALESLIRARGVETVFELNPGGHFQQAEERLARGVAWIAGLR